jgi:hypothetical protein
MTPLIVRAASNVNDYLENLVTKNEYLDSKKLFDCVALDSVASCFFGVEIDSVNNPENEISKHLTNISSTSASRNVKLIINCNYD